MSPDFRRRARQSRNSGESRYDVVFEKFMTFTSCLTMRLSVAISVALLSAASLAVACNVPVFRYALERWPADMYDVVVLHSGALSDEQSAQVESLRSQSRSSGGFANFNLHTIAASKIEDELLAGIWQEHGGEEQPVLALLYPRNAREVPDRLVTAAPLSQQAIGGLIDSPIRQAVVDELLAGESAVWVFVPSGNEAEDKSALSRLNDQVAKNEKQLELPPQDEIEADEFFRAETPIELRLGFSILTLDRSDPREKFFLAMLLGSEIDLEDLDQPMAFPVIGRGRVLYALVGKGIFPDTITSAARFVVGPCSCQVKEQNPGFDLLLNVNWDEKLGGSVLSDPAPEISTKPRLLAIPPGK